MQRVAEMEIVFTLQIRSAFAMAFSTLTDPKIILSLGPKRSILGTIIRPDPNLIERKGGLNGEVTFNSLLPGAGEPIQQKFGEQDMLCNWQLDDEEELLPRGVDTSAEPSRRSNSTKKDVDTSAEPSTHSNSTKKRKSASKKSSSKKLKENGDIRHVAEKENGIKKKSKKMIKSY